MLAQHDSVNGAAKRAADPGADPARTLDLDLDNPEVGPLLDKLLPGTGVTCGGAPAASVTTSAPGAVACLKPSASGVPALYSMPA